MIRIEDEDIGIIIEVKYAENAALEEACRDALEQIETKEYEAELEAEGCREVLKYGIACFRKKCRVMVRGEAKSIY